MNRWKTLTLAPHRLHFFCGMASLLLASGWWAVHLVARYAGKPIWALDLQVAPIWAHSFLMLFVVLPTFMFGFLFTTFPRWMNGPAVPRTSYVATAVLLFLATLAWLAGAHYGLSLQLLAVALATAGLITGLVALLRVLVDAQQVVSHAVVASVAVSVGTVSVAGFGYGLAEANDFALHFAVRAALWGFLFPVFFAVCHRMVPFFSQNAVPGYVVWRPLWMLLAVVALAYARLLLGTAGTFDWLPVADVALALLTATCAIRWTSLGSRGNPLLWTLYAGVAWLPVAMILQATRDAGFVLTGTWLLGRAPIHALGIGFFGSMLVAMVTRVTMGHSGRGLAMNRATLACFVGVQAAAVLRVSSEIVAAPDAVRDLLLGSMFAWIAAFGTWAAIYFEIYLSPRSDGKPG
ncbi:MAG: NnrS family protein [Steroidobacteraceae bacterium]|nr:NnrS family protein [Steroidobacteraceae bacterium]